MQQASCTPLCNGAPDATQKLHGQTRPAGELQVASPRACNTQPGPLTRHRVTAALVAAIHRTCDARGDDDRNRRALVDECSRMTPEAQADLLAHFTVEAARWEAACRGTAP